MKQIVRSRSIKVIQGQGQVKFKLAPIRRENKPRHMQNMKQIQKGNAVSKVIRDQGNFNVKLA